MGACMGTSPSRISIRSTELSISTWSCSCGRMARMNMNEDPEDVKNQPVIYRKVLLRIVFWALGLAACFGAAGVIFAGHDTLWRIVATCAATGAGAFLLLATSRQLERESNWLPGLMAVSLIVAE